MKLFLIVLCFFIVSPGIYSKIFPLQQLRIKNYLNHKPVVVKISSSYGSFSFHTFISRNSRGILFEKPKASALKNDKLSFFEKVTIPNHDQHFEQVLLDFRLMSLCKFSNNAPLGKKSHLSFSFDITNKGTKETTTFSVNVLFKGFVRRELLVNDVHEFKNMLKQLKNSCQTRKNQLKNRRDWFIQRGNELYDDVKKLHNSEVQRDKFFNPKNPINVDNRIKEALNAHSNVAGYYKTLKKKAQNIATEIGGLESHALQLEKNRADDERSLNNAKRELEVAKLQMEMATTEFDGAKKNLNRLVPEARKLINKASEEGNQRDHQKEILKLAINS